MKLQLPSTVNPLLSYRQNSECEV